MKAILVVELEDDVNLNDIEIRYAIFKYINQDKYRMPVEVKVDGCPLKPMPETRDVGYPIDDYAVGFSDGWDAFKKEITE